MRRVERSSTGKARVGEEGRPAAPRQRACRAHAHPRASHAAIDEWRDGLILVLVVLTTCARRKGQGQALRHRLTADADPSVRAALVPVLLWHD